MANIKDLKKRIRSTKGTHKITSAMKLVSASKLAKIQGRILGLKPYSHELFETVRIVSAITQNYKHPYFNDTDNKHAYLLVISSDKGLCGSYNSALVKEVRNFLETHSGLDFKVHFIGKKVREVIEKEVNKGEVFHFEKAEPSLEEMRKISEKLAEAFKTGEVGRVFVAYNTFHSAMSTEPVIRQLLPFGLPELEKEEIKTKFPYDFKYEPSAEEILETMVPEVYVNTLYTAALDAVASEHGMRMVAMENATKNSEEVIRDLTLKMNKLRQAAITTELIEVVSGAESLNG
ncbi:MAG: ATP synthase F1 subunit gamma [Halobacteriovoraceae bacterium]|nr:ATP synthase F1 subunit gamma [Halobacteriovoraceae bacterium]